MNTTKSLIERESEEAVKNFAQALEIIAKIPADACFGAEGTPACFAADCRRSIELASDLTFMDGDGMSLLMIKKSRQYINFATKKLAKVEAAR